MVMQKLRVIYSLSTLALCGAIVTACGDTATSLEAVINDNQTVVEDTPSASNQAPTVQPVNKITRLGQPVTFFLEVEDLDGDTLSYQITSNPQFGIAEINQDHSITYTPVPGITGVDRFEVGVSDQQATATTTVVFDNDLAFSGEVTGDVDDMSTVEVLLSADGHLRHTTPDESGAFKFYALPDNEYVLKVRKNGFKSAPAQTVQLDRANLNVSSTQKPRYEANELTHFALEPLDNSRFSFHWEEDQSTAGYDYAAHINEPLVIEFLGKELTVVDDSSANRLQHDFNILLVNAETTAWTQEHAYRLAETMKTIPQQQRDPYQEQSLVASQWQLTDRFIENDIQITATGNTKSVLISTAAFVNATPKMAKIEGKRGIFYSQRLHHALVRFVTDNGTNKAAYEKILNERYGISTVIADYATLTGPTDNEEAGRFQPFHAEEIVQLINMFEEMPKGLHKLPQLQYLLRRLDGTPHPLYPEAPAVAWTTQGYIEFMESAFNTSGVEHMHRLILHEKSHFLWQHQFDTALKEDWIALGGWYQENGDWFTRKQTEFVSAYAHLKNPNEDMAESISFFIINPDKLKSRALGKYEFVRDRIMQGNLYISQIREDLTFQVYNLYPDYVFPGKIKRVDIQVDGLPEADKTVTLELELHALDTELEGAKHAYLRILSEIGTFTDLYLYPIDENGNALSGGQLSTRLRGSFTLNKHAKAGFWRTPQIKITDAVGNERFEGANDFGWKLYINNPLEDVTAPEYVKNTAVLSQSVTTIEEQDVQVIHATWQVNEAGMMADSSPCYASMNDEILSTYRVEEYGNYHQETARCSVDFIMPNYMPSSTYSMNFIKMKDSALNTRGVYFTNTEGGLRAEDINLDEEPQHIALVTTQSDVERPELDLNELQISAIPTNPEAPNGETVVTITFKVRDNISGYNIASLNLRDPQGINHHYWVYNADTWTLFPTDDPTQWHTYTRNIVLPVGSAPGTWGLSEMTLYDRAGNFNGYDFTEIVHFDVSE
jgi:hypothetical protein